MKTQENYNLRVTTENSQPATSHALEVTEYGNYIKLSGEIATDEVGNVLKEVVRWLDIIYPKSTDLLNEVKGICENHINQIKGV